MSRWKKKCLKKKPKDTETATPAPLVLPVDDSITESPGTSRPASSRTILTEAPDDLDENPDAEETPVEDMDASPEDIENTAQEDMDDAPAEDMDGPEDDPPAEDMDEAPMEDMDDAPQDDMVDDME